MGHTFHNPEEKGTPSEQCQHILANWCSTVPTTSQQK